MADDNHSEFAKQVLRAIAFLYSNHPAACCLSGDEICRPPASGDRKKEDFASGTIRWLYDNGIVRGELEVGRSGAYINPAQLSAASYAILRDNDRNIGAGPLGQAVVNVASGDDPRAESVVADLLVRRLC